MDDSDDDELTRPLRCLPLTAMCWRRLSVNPRRAMVVLAVLLPAWLIAPCVLAAGQTVNLSTGAVDGRVTDPSGAILSGAAVSISSGALMRPRQAATAADGFYRFVALPPGEHTLVFERSGFRTIQREGIHVAAGFTATIDVVMELEPLVSEVAVVRESPVLDRQATTIGASFGADQFANLPGARNMFAILAATPAVQVTRFDVGGNTAALGMNYGAFGTPGNNRPMLEGIDTTGVAGTGFVFDYGSLDEVWVGTAAHSPEWPKPGVQMLFIAKSGGNQFHGSLYGDYENRRWQSFNIDSGQVARAAPEGGSPLPRDANRLWSYHDVNAGAGGFVRPDTLWWYASFRDQEMAARYVNFAVLPHRTRVTNYSGKGTYQARPGSKLIAYGQVGRNRQPNRLDPSGLTGLNATTALNLSAESTTAQTGVGWVWKGEWSLVLNDRAFAEVRAGQFGANLRERPNGAAPRFEDIVTLRVRGGNRDYAEELRREQVSAVFSYFEDRWLGRHQFKGGGEAYRTTQADDWRASYPGDVLHVLRNGAASEVYLFETPALSTAGFWAYAAHANDSWRLNGRITLNLGVRFDRYRLFLPAQEHPVGRFNVAAQAFAARDNVMDWNVVAPRLGVAIDPGGGGRTVVKFNYSQYWVNPGVATTFNVNPNSSPWWSRHSWSDADGSGRWEPGEEGEPLASRGGAALESLDPALALPFVREAAGWIERELGAGFGARMGVVWRGDRQQYSRQDVSRPFAAFAVPVRIADPGIDGRGGTADDGVGIDGRQLIADIAAPVNVVRNVPRAQTSYWTLDVAASRRFAGRWSLSASFARTWSEDQANSYFGQAVRQNMFPLTPNDLINAGPDGRHEFSVWSARVHGTYQGRWDVRVTPLLRHQSGQPFGRTFAAALNYGNVRILAEPIGTRRMDNVTIVDVRIEKGIRVRPGLRAAALVDVFNLLNANPEQNISWSSGSFLRPLNVVAPRIARIGVKLEW